MGKHAFRMASLECLAKTCCHALQAEDLWPVCSLLRPYSAHMTGKMAATVYFNKGLKLKLHVLMSKFFIITW